MKQESVQDSLVISKEDQIIPKQGIEYLPINRDVNNYEYFVLMLCLSLKKKTLINPFLLIL